MKKLLLVLAVVVLALVGLFYYLHGFDDVELVEVEIPEMNLVYVKHVGSYYKVGSVMMELHERLVEAGVDSSVGAGIYLDDPAATPADELRSIVGDVVSDEELAMLGNDFEVVKIKGGEGVMGEFPYRNMLSFMMAPMKIYAEMAVYLEDSEVVPNAGLEVYDMDNKKIMIYMDLADSFAGVAEEVFE